MYKKILEKIESIPFEPGCYLYKNAVGEIIYVGKAKSLRKRVRQYFQKEHYREPKIDIMVSQIVDLDWITVKTETDALILESNLIKKYRPKYNKLQKDDKQYIWIKITNEDIPRVIRVREKKRDGAKYFGPFPDGNSARKTLLFLRRLYPYRVCNKKMYFGDLAKGRESYDNDDETIRFTKTSRLCLDYHIGLCTGPCDNLVTIEEYKDVISNIEEFLKGKRSGLLKSLASEMKSYSLDKEYEKAATVRDRISELNYITQKISIRSGEDEERIRLRKEKEKESIAKQLLDRLEIKGYSDSLRIECYDVSNIQGTDPVTSMVVFEKGQSKKLDYRYFKIRSKDTPDDYAMMGEGLKRRLKYLTDSRRDKNDKSSFYIKPDLIVVDGGKGQLSMALEIVGELSLEIPVVGIAKREEEIIKRVDGKYKIIRLRRDSRMLHLVQQLRDEAHRFAITKHRNLRGKKMVKTILSEIPGVGDKSIEKLIKAFGSVDEIKKADFEALNAVLKNKAKAAEVARFWK